MTVTSCLILLNIIAYIQTTVLNTNLDKKSVNLALETVLEFDKKDNAADVKVIDNVQKFLSKIRNVLTKDDEQPSRRSGGGDEITFKDFLQNSIVIIKSYKDEDIMNLIDVIDEEIKNYHYEGCKFHELAKNTALKSLVFDKFEKIKSAPIPKIRKKLDKFLKKLQRKKFRSEDRTLLDYIDSLYRLDSSQKLTKVLAKLRSYGSQTKRSNWDLVKIIKDALRTLVFDHYSNLKADTRKDLGFKIEAYYSSDKNDVRNGHSKHSSIKTKSVSKRSYKKKTTPKTDSDDFVYVEPARHRINPEEIDSENEYTTKKKIRSHHKQTLTTNERFHTLWEEPRTMPKKHKKKRKSNLRVREPEVREIMEEHNAVIEVAASTTASSTPSQKPVMRHKKTSKLKRRGHNSAHVQRKQKKEATTDKPERTNKKPKRTTKKPKRTTLKTDVETTTDGTSNEGLSIDYDDDTPVHSLRKQNADDRFKTVKENVTKLTSKEDAHEKSLHSYVLHKLSNLEKAMADVKHQIERNLETTKENKKHKPKTTTSSEITHKKKFTLDTITTTREKDKYFRAVDLQTTQAKLETSTATYIDTTELNITQKVTQTTTAETETDPKDTTAPTSTEITSPSASAVTGNASTTIEEASLLPVFRAGSSNESMDMSRSLKTLDTKQGEIKSKLKNIVKFASMENEFNDTWGEYYNKTMKNFAKKNNALENVEHLPWIDQISTFPTLSIPTLSDDFLNVVTSSPPDIRLKANTTRTRLLTFTDLMHMEASSPSDILNEFKIGEHVSDIMNSLNSSRRLMRPPYGTEYDDPDGTFKLDTLL